MGSEDLVWGVLRDLESSSLDEKHKALFRFVKKVNGDSPRITGEDIEPLYAAGWDDEAIYYAITVCALFNFYNRWIDAAGVESSEMLHGPVLNHASMLIDAAIDGQGIALARTALAAWDLINGRLVKPFSIDLPLSNTYWIVCPKATAMLPKIGTFRDWLLAEAAADTRQLKTLRAPQRTL